MNDYCVVQASSSWYLEEGVGYLMRNGWKPQGGICVTPENLFYQAMVKNEI